MIRELEKLSRLRSFNSVMIVTVQGDALYCSNHNQDIVISRKTAMLRNLLKQMHHAVNVLFSFEKGVGLVSGNSLGYVVLFLNDGSEKERASILLEELKRLCDSDQFKRNMLLSILAATHVSMKPRVTRELASFADETVCKQLLEILKKVDVANLPGMTAFIHEVFIVLGLCCGQESVSVIQDFLKRGKEAGTLEIHLERSAQNLCKQLAEKKKKNNLAPSAQDRNNAPHAGQHDKITVLVEAGKLEEAGQLILEEIKKAVSINQFIKAEKLRQRLIAVNPSMLTEIIRAAEIIEEAQLATIPVDFKETWGGLVEILADDEFAGLFHHLKYQKCKTGEVLVVQGDFSSRLYLVQSGNLQVYGSSEGKEVVIRVAGGGDVVGGASFFESSVWTFNVRSLGAEIYILGKKQFNALIEAYPGIEAKLLEFCLARKSSENIFTRKERTRRKFKRIALSGKILMALLARNGKETGPGIKGDLFDISMGGISFCLNISRKKNAERLFGSRVKLKIPNTDKSKGVSSVKMGRIVAVRGLHLISNEYSIHVEFDTVLSYPELYAISGQA